MNIEVDVYKALEALLLQECSGDAIVDDDDERKLSRVKMFRFRECVWR